MARPHAPALAGHCWARSVYTDAAEGEAHRHHCAQGAY